MIEPKHKGWMYKECCEAVLEAAKKEDTSLSDFRVQDGRLWRCKCGQVWIHVCDEAEGCCWEPAPPVSSKSMKSSMRSPPASRGGRVQRRMSLDEHDKFDR